MRDVERKFRGDAPVAPAGDQNVGPAGRRVQFGVGLSVGCCPVLGGQHGDLTGATPFGVSDQAMVRPYGGVLHLLQGFALYGLQPDPHELGHV